jgi:hypothetical protein
MYAEQCSGEFIKSVHSFLKMAEPNKRNSFMSCVGMRRITLPQRPFIFTCSGLVSYPAIIVGLSMEKEGL